MRIRLLSLAIIVISLMMTSCKDTGPTGNPSTDAKQYYEELIELWNSDVTSEEDLKSIDRRLYVVCEKYEKYYEKNNKELYEEIDKLLSDPEFVKKYESAWNNFRKNVKKYKGQDIGEIRKTEKTYNWGGLGMEPTGDPATDAEMIVGELLEYMEKDYDSVDDFVENKVRVFGLEAAFNDYYMEKGEDKFKEFEKECGRVTESPEMKKRIEEANNKLEKNLKKIGYNEDE